MPGIEVRDLTFSFDGARVLDRISLSVPAGEVLALIGRSGAGKTTLLKLINRLLEPPPSAIAIAEQDVREWDVIRLRRSIGYVIQEGGLFPHLTVADNVRLPQVLEQWESDRANARVEYLLDLVGLPPSTFGSRWPHELSGGQRQRVGVARALALDPPILLMDEPFGALDSLTRAELQLELQRIQKGLRKTIVFVTHDINEAMAVGDRIAVFDAGRLVSCATTDEFLDRPESAVRNLLGTPDPLASRRRPA